MLIDINLASPKFHNCSKHCLKTGIFPLFMIKITFIRDLKRIQIKSELPSININNLLNEKWKKMGRV